ncbi:TonB-dependent receptor [Arcticibacterium luteifluviistationis]|uniref:TonB-dependent receptor n=1 Tax=Arcticibacterium luteifluviistationis TaxID=1784714 RepID=A0A2Z4G996_9BACT|nr:TonB-dependent receptor [Arcticibacterium luteifluviistationis]AWV97650.1 TonB-dependent receptor [Arcticibacterium luteifluviistationis]
MKISYLSLLLFLICFKSLGQKEMLKLNIQVIDSVTNTPLENANISIKPCSCGGMSDAEGLFSISLPAKSYQVSTSYIGFKENRQTLVLGKNTFVKVFLNEDQGNLSEIIVKAKKDNLESPQMGLLALKASELKKIPAALGEFDVLRSITLMAGVNNSGEVSNGVSIRGGTLDQTLLLYEYAPVFNPTHLFGLFSVFTPDALASVDIFKANIPAKYGGRSTSVVDIKVKNPLVDKFKLSGGIGLVSSRLTVETPLIKDKLMVIAGVRAGLTDFLLPIFSKDLKNIKANFYDGTIKLMYLPTRKDQLSFTGFYSKDFYQIDLITKIKGFTSEINQYDFETNNGTLKWLHNFNDKTSLKTVLVRSYYTPKNIIPELESSNKIEYQSKINYSSLTTEISQYVSQKFDFYSGVQLNKYKINPGDLNPGTATNVLPISLLEENSYELSAYSNFNWNPSSHLSFAAGFRYNQFLFQGPYVLNIYDETGNVILDSEFIKKGEKVKSYNNLEPRFGASLKINKTTSIKASYSKANQYLQNIYNSTTPLPTSRWKTSDSFIKPQSSDSFGIGVFKNINDGAIDLSLEGYYRNSKNNLTYKPGADFFLAESVEQSLQQIKGKAYGVELSFKKNGGKVNGWLNYTWSRSLLRSDGDELANRINNNNWFNSDFDRPHVLNANIFIKSNSYNTISFNFTGQTGRPYTIPNGIFQLKNVDVPIFLERNNSRLPTYHRLDFSWKIENNKKENPRWLGDWTFTVYNVYGRKNAYSKFYTQRSGNLDKDYFGGFALGSYQLSISRSPVFALTYNFTFH